MHCCGLNMILPTCKLVDRKFVDLMNIANIRRTNIHRPTVNKKACPPQALSDERGE
jgi:hypothetical protein